MIEVIVKDPTDQESFNKAVKMFKKLVDKAGFLQEIRDRRYFQKPSEKRRLKAKMRQKYGHSYKKES